MKIYLEDDFIKVVNNTPPQNYNVNDIKYFENSKFSIFDPIKIFSIKYVFLFPELVVFKYGFFDNVLTNRNLRNIKFLLLLVKKLFTRKINYLQDDYLLIIDDWSNGYFHWISDSLQRLYYFQKNSKLDNIKILLPSSYNKISYVTESLKYFKYNVTYVSSRKNYILKSLYIQSHIGNSGHYYPQFIQSVSNYFINNTDIINQYPNSSDFKKPFIYISRRFAEKRRIINENELCKYLVSKGFNIIYFENLSFFDQIRLMKNCKVLLSIHGSGLVNCLFQNPNSVVIEIKHNKDYINHCFYLLATSLHHKYYYFLSEGSTEDPHVSDLTIDMDNFRSFFSSIIYEFN